MEDIKLPLLLETFADADRGTRLDWKINAFMSRLNLLIGGIKFSILFWNDGNLLHGRQSGISERIVPTLALLVGLSPLLCLHSQFNFFIDLVDILLGRRKLLLKAHFFLLQGKLRPFGKLSHQVFNLVRHILLIHRVDDIFAIGVKLWREDLRHSLRGVGLVDTG